MPDRAALAGIVYVLKSGIPWRMLPKEFGCSGVTCWRRLRDWQKAGVWRRLRRALLDRLGRGGSSTGRGRPWTRPASWPKKGEKTGPNRVDRGRPGSKRHLLLEGNGIPLAVVRTGAQVHDSKAFEELVDAVKPVKGRSQVPSIRHLLLNQS